MLLRDFITLSQDSLSELYPKDESAAIVSRLCSELLDIKPYTHILEPEFTLSSVQEERLSGALGRLLSGEPLQYITGYQDFYGYRFKVSPAVLIPRPETEYLCRLVLDRIKMTFGERSSSPDIIDLCSGSGCISWTLAAELPEAKVTGVDVSSDALAVSRSQQICSNVPDFIQADVLLPSLLPSLFPSDRKFDIIVSNPPYVKESEKAVMCRNVLDYEPGLALFVEDDNPLVFYHAVADFAQSLLSPSGFGAVEINESLGEQTVRVFRDRGFGNVSLEDDLSGKHRFVFFQR